MKIEEIAKSIKEIIDEFELTEDKPSSKEFPYMYGYQSGLQTVTEELKELLEKIEESE